MFKHAITIAENTDMETAAKEALAMALQKMSKPASALFFFSRYNGVTFEGHKLTDGLPARTNIWGASVDGLILDRYFSDPAVGVIVTEERVRSYESVADLPTSKRPTILLFAKTSGRENEFCDTIDEKVKGTYHGKTQVAGFTAAFGSRGYVLNNDGFHSGESIAAFYGVNAKTRFFVPYKINPDTAQNYHGTVTGCEGQTIFSIDHEPALKVINRWRKELGYAPLSENSAGLDSAHTPIFTTRSGYKVYSHINGFKDNVVSTGTLWYQRDTIEMIAATGDDVYAQATSNNGKDFVLKIACAGALSLLSDDHKRRVYSRGLIIGAHGEFGRPKNPHNHEVSEHIYHGNLMFNTMELK